jgi:hypothetical protein
MYRTTNKPHQAAIGTQEADPSRTRADWGRNCGLGSTQSWLIQRLTGDGNCSSSKEFALVFVLG